MKFTRNKIAPPRIEMLPLIDIVFLLLVFFIYAMLSMAVHRGQSVDLPSSSQAVMENKEAIGVTIRAVSQGVDILIDQEPVSLALFSERLRTMAGASQDGLESEVRIFADKAVSYQELFQVLDRVKQAGLSRISLQAEPDGALP